MCQTQTLHGGREGKIAKAENKVIRPANPWTPHVHAFLSFMHENGFTSLPKPYGINADGLEVVSFVEGTVYNDSFPDELLTDEILREAATLLRRYHNTAAGYMDRLTGHEIWMLPPRTPAEVLCHGDFAPYNMTILNGHVHGLIDFDTLHPGPRLWDLAYAVYRWVPFVSPTNPDYHDDLDEQLRKLKVFADTYGLSAEEKGKLPAMMIERLQCLVAFMTEQADDGNEDFQKNIEDGHVRLYLEDIQYIRTHQETMLKTLLSQ